MLIVISTLFLYKAIFVGRCLSPLKWFIPWKLLYKLVLYACAQVGGWKPKSGSAHSQSCLKKSAVIFAWEYFGKW